MEWVIPVVVALITGPMVVILQNLRKENSDQHSESRDILLHLVEKVDDVQTSVHHHALEFREHLFVHHNEQEKI